MAHPSYTSDEIVEQGQALYDQQIREKVEPQHHGKFLVLDVVTGDYEIAPDDLTASERLLARDPKAVIYGLRIGSPASYRLGGHSLRARP